MNKQNLKPRRKGVSYAKWGYIFIAPFFLTYLVWTLFPQLLTIYNSFFENYMDGLKHVGPNFVGLKNYIKLFTPDKNGTIVLLKYAANTLIMWLLCAVPQILVSLTLAVFFTSTRLNIKGQSFFKAVIYMPNLIMASAFSMLFFTLFSNVGPVNQMLVATGLMEESFDFFNNTIAVRSLVGCMNFLMWFGNTTLVLMSGIMGIDQTLFDAAAIDGATSFQTFRKVTLPLLRPILVYTIITAMIGGIQMFDVPQVLTNGLGRPDRNAMTLVMYLNSYLTPSKNYGMSGAISVLVFIITGILSLIVFSFIDPNRNRKEG